MAIPEEELSPSCSRRLRKQVPRSGREPHASVAHTVLTLGCCPGPCSHLLMEQISSPLGRGRVPRARARVASGRPSPEQ